MPGSTKEDYDRANRYLHALADKTGGRLYQANDTRAAGGSFFAASPKNCVANTASVITRRLTTAMPATDVARIRVRVRQPNLAVKARGQLHEDPGSESP